MKDRVEGGRGHHTLGASLDRLFAGSGGEGVVHRRCSVGAGHCRIVRRQDATGRRHEDDFDTRNRTAFRIGHPHHEQGVEWLTDDGGLTVAAEDCNPGWLPRAGKQQAIAAAGRKREQEKG
jgi:hypothetical protein